MKWYNITKRRPTDDTAVDDVMRTGTHPEDVSRVLFRLLEDHAIHSPAGYGRDDTRVQNLRCLFVFPLSVPVEVRKKVAIWQDEQRTVVQMGVYGDTCGTNPRRDKSWR